VSSVVQMHRSGLANRRNIDASPPALSVAP